MTTKATPLKIPLAPANPVANIPVNIQHGHDGEQIVMIFSQSVLNLKLSPEQAVAFIEAIKGSMEKLARHQQEKLN